MTGPDAALRERMSKLEALFARAGTPGEKQAAGAALERLEKKLTPGQSGEELQFSMPDRWSVKLFLAILRKHGLVPYRYPRQRRTTVMVRMTRGLLDEVVWPEFIALQAELTSYFEETVDHLITTAMHSDGSDEGMETAQLPS